MFIIIVSIKIYKNIQKYTKIISFHTLCSHIESQIIVSFEPPSIGVKLNCSHAKQIIYMDKEGNMNYDDEKMSPELFFSISWAPGNSASCCVCMYIRMPGRNVQVHYVHSDILTQSERPL
jgi:hypothetical protein